MPGHDCKREQRRKSTRKRRKSQAGVQDEQSSLGTTTGGGRTRGLERLAYFRHLCPGRGIRRRRRRGKRKLEAAGFAAMKPTLPPVSFTPAVLYNPVLSSMRLPSASQLARFARSNSERDRETDRREFSRHFWEKNQKNCAETMGKEAFNPSLMDSSEIRSASASVM